MKAFLCGLVLAIFATVAVGQSIIITVTPIQTHQGAGVTSAPAASTRTITMAQLPYDMTSLVTPCFTSSSGSSDAGQASFIVNILTTPNIANLKLHFAGSAIISGGASGNSMVSVWGENCDDSVSQTPINKATGQGTYPFDATVDISNSSLYHGSSYQVANSAADPLAGTVSVTVNTTTLMLQVGP